jgi:pilus assembly protein CpaF
MPRATELSAVPDPTSGVPSSIPTSVGSKTFNAVLGVSSAVYERPLRALFEPLATLLDDERVTCVLVNGPAHVFFEKDGELQASEAKFDSAETLASLLQIVAEVRGRVLDAAHPILHVRLAEDLVLEAVIAPFATPGPTLTFRRIARKRSDARKLLESGFLHSDAVRTLKKLLFARRNMVVAGARGAGKTTLLNALLALLPSMERVLVVEQFRELEALHAHVVHLEAEPADVPRSSATLTHELLSVCSGMRADRVVLGEVQTAEQAQTWLQLTARANSPGLTTREAESAEDALLAFEAMSSNARGAGFINLRRQIARALSVVVELADPVDAAPGVVRISEVRLDARGDYVLHKIFERGQVA